MASLIQADMAGLQAMTGRFSALGGQVAVTATGGAGSAVQSTAAAVNAVRTNAIAAGAALAGRMQSTATEVATGAGKHAAQESKSAAELTALSSPPVALV